MFKWLFGEKNKCSHKFGKVENDGFQYCAVCGEARLLDCVHVWKTVGRQKQSCTKCGYTENIEVVDCQHEWKTEDRNEIVNTRYGREAIVGKSYYVVCIHCGIHDVNNCTIYSRPTF